MLEPSKPLDALQGPAQPPMRPHLLGRPTATNPENHIDRNFVRGRDGVVRADRCTIQLEAGHCSLRTHSDVDLPALAANF